MFRCYFVSCLYYHYCAKAILGNLNGMQMTRSSQIQHAWPMQVIALVLTKKRLMLLQKTHANFHSNMIIQFITLAQERTFIGFGVQHQLMLIWRGKHLVTVMTLAHLKVFIFIEAFKMITMRISSSVFSFRLRDEQKTIICYR